MQSRREPSLFLTNKMGEAADEKLALIKDSDRFSSIHFLTSLSSASDIEYIRPNGTFAPSISVITWSTHRDGGRIRASFSENHTK